MVSTAAQGTAHAATGGGRIGQPANADAISQPGRRSAFARQSPGAPQLTMASFLKSPGPPAEQGSMNLSGEGYTVGS